VGRASHRWLFRWRFAQSRVAQLGLVPTPAAFALRSAISTPPRFAINYSVPATLALFAETHQRRTSDVERDQEVSRKPSLRCYTGITYSIKSAGQNKPFAPVHSAARPVHYTGSELVVLVLNRVLNVVSPPRSPHHGDSVQRHRRNCPLRVVKRDLGSFLGQRFHQPDAVLRMAHLHTDMESFDVHG
jgi:hypothetical protein